MNLGLCVDEWVEGLTVYRGKKVRAGVGGGGQRIGELCCEHSPDTAWRHPEDVRQAGDMRGEAGASCPEGT